MGSGDCWDRWRQFCQRSHSNPKGTFPTDQRVGGGPLSALFESPARVRIIGAFVAERGRDLGVSGVARLADVVRSTVYRHLDDLERLGIVEHSRDVQAGHSSMYQLDEDSDIAELLYQLEGITLERLLEVEGHLDE